MGKKGSLFSAIKRAFSPHSKEKLGYEEAERKNGKEKKKKGFGKLKRGESSSFLPIFREPSSIEKILAEAERDHNLVFRPPTHDRSNPPSASPSPPLRPASPQSPPPRDDFPRLDSSILLSLKSPDGSKPSSASSSTPLKPVVPSPRQTSPRVVSPRADDHIKPPSPSPTSPRVSSPQAFPPKPLTPRADPLRLESPRLPSPEPPPRPEPSTLDTPRPTTPKPPSTRAELRGETVSRPEPTLLVQHASATKIQAAFRGYTARRSFRALKGLVRLQGVVKGYSVKRQTVNAMKYMQKLVRVQSKIQSHRTKISENQTQVEKDKAKRSASEAGNDHWDDSVLTKEERDARSQRKTDAIIKRERSMAYAYSHKVTPKSAQDVGTSGGLSLWWNWGDQQLPLASHYRLTPTRLSPSPLSQSSNQHHFKLDNFDSSTPKSSRSTRSRPFHTSRYSRGRLRDSPFKDDDSLTSCPPFPSYMAPTVSAKAKVRPNSNPKERVMGTPSSVSSEKRRVSYPPAQQGKDMFRWNKGSLLMSNRGPGSPVSVVLEKHKTVKSVGHLSIDSTVGRKPFNKYV
ncbi:Protein IQ-DOMAIN 14 [Raphanus sativus]|uniref:Protein IQ-DOMAIN 14 n=1 Tax=Raphanus sativus TaxID=3726 RepID=A0A6J0NKB9_RAPSA|nr:protein IQ-DOMAIN 14 [Raphanus sativus]KAJ4904189.1 Protein IQ-DOMAIN 14 [Raphanus sativus]